MTAHDRPSRRTVLRTAGGLCGAAATLSVPAEASGGRAETPGADQYVATVDRIVDGRYAVLLLEEDRAVVDQLVVPADEYDGLEERDILLVVVKDGELLAYEHLPQRPGRGADTDRGRCGR